MPSYLTVARDAEAELEVKRSRFIARVRRVESEAAARAVVEQARKEHWDARHHCSAYVLGPRGEIARSNDDGEPAGTAGMPILQAIHGRELSDVAVVVIRYFGGTLLGAGGLVRAYGDTAAAGLAAAGTRERVAGLLAELDVSLADIGRVENGLRADGADVRDVEYAAAATFRLVVPTDEIDRYDAAVARLTAGAARLRYGDLVWTDGP